MKLIKEFLLDINGKTVADIGCGNGSISFLLWSLGAKVHSFDIDAKALQKTRSWTNLDNRRTRFESNLCQGDATRLPINKETFDVVCCLETLEHEPNDTAAVEEIERVTKPGGMVILSVPYDPRVTGEEKSFGLYRRYSFKTFNKRLSSSRLHLERTVFWYFPVLTLLEKVKLRYINAALGLFIDVLNDKNNSRRFHNLRNHDTFARSLVSFYRTKLWRKIASPALMKALNLNKLFQNLPYSNDVFLILRKTNNHEMDRT